MGGITVVDCASSTGQATPGMTINANNKDSNGLASLAVIGIFDVDAGINSLDAILLPVLLISGRNPYPHITEITGSCDRRHSSGWVAFQVVLSVSLGFETRRYAGPVTALSSCGL